MESLYVCAPSVGYAASPSDWQAESGPSKLFFPSLKISIDNTPWPLSLKLPLTLASTSHLSPSHISDLSENR